MEYVISIKEAAKRLGISTAQGYIAAKDGRIPTIQLGERRRVVPIQQFDRLLSGDLKTGEGDGGS